MAKLTLSLGSNLGDRAGFLRQARTHIADRLGPLSYVSEIVETPAWGNTEQGPFLNQVVVAEVKGADAGAVFFHHLLDEIQRIEAELGRERKVHWGPRTLDIDMIFLDDLLYEDERLSLPHPWWREREFVVKLLPADLPFGSSW